MMSSGKKNGKFPLYHKALREIFLLLRNSSNSQPFKYVEIERHGQLVAKGNMRLFDSKDGK